MPSLRRGAAFFFNTEACVDQSLGPPCRAKSRDREVSRFACIGSAVAAMRRPCWLSAGRIGKRNANMVDRNLLREFDVSDDELTALVTAEDGTNTLDQFLGEGQSFEIGRIVSGKVVEVVGDQVVVDVGYKSEGLVPLNEWEDEPPPAAGRRRRGPARGHGRRDRRDRLVAQEGAPDASLGDGHLPLSRGGRRQGTRHAQDQGRPAGRYRRQRLPARQPGRYPPPVRHRRLHRSRDRVHDLEDRREPAQHRRQPAQADRDHARDRRRSSCSRRSPSARSARGPSRTSPTSAPSSTWAASTACCTSPT